MFWEIRYLGKPFGQNWLLSRKDINRMNPNKKVFVERKSSAEIASLDVGFVQDSLSGRRMWTYFNPSEYAKTWRCWKMKPTIAESKSAAWML